MGYTNEDLDLMDKAEKIGTAIGTFIAPIIWAVLAVVVVYLMLMLSAPIG
jgi:hypothetical protein